MLLPDLDIYSFDLTLEFLQDSRLPVFKGNILRSAFATSFRDVTCYTGKKTCDKCMLKTDCHYFRLFETELPSSQFWFLKGIKKIPHSIVIQCTDYNTIYKEDDKLKITINIVGSDVKKIPFIVYSFIILGQKGIGKKHVRLLLSEVINNTGTEKVKIFDKKSGLNEDKYVKMNLIVDTNDDVNEMNIEFLTPVRLQSGGKEVLSPRKFTPDLFLNSLYRRYLGLSSIYNETSLNFDDYPRVLISELQLVKSGLKFKNLLRYSYRQKDVIPLGGFIGSIVIKGDIGKYFKLIKSGEYIGVGKNTIFGLGTYKIKY